MTPREFDRARAWRESLELTQAQLGEKIGYARETVWWFERGATPPNRGNGASGKIKPWVWLRYKMACAGYAASIGGSLFDWQVEK